MRLGYIRRARSFDSESLKESSTCARNLEHLKGDCFRYSGYRFLSEIISSGQSSYVDIGHFDQPGLKANTSPIPHTKR
jgi:hypothetical protein